ncbi:low-density lipoprotein receptor-related protein 6-like [Strongylocentrotus purpuratus]|uniref:Uncharacterized protein n=1 Tax=Strongylocentrotus purpuratus TaxID=7668 RepID=A0A7M7NYL7_STRPU|nr:low-density lipoprotein receptor-related protein 6-like [Strongylocentrotus purpuratus]
MSAISSSTSTSDPSTTNVTSESFAKIFVADSGEHKIFFADLRDELSFKPIPSTWHPEFLAYDSTRKKLYWNDFTAKQIYRADVNGLNREVVTFASNEAPAGVAIAEELGVLYIAYTLSNKITSMSIKPDKTIPRDDPDFATQGIKEPRALQTDEEQGYIYMTMNGEVARKHLFLPQDALQTIYKNIHLNDLSGLSIDFTRNPRRIFFCSITGGRVFYKDMSTSPDKSIATELTYSGQSPYYGQLQSLSYINGFLYWVTRQNYTRSIGITTYYDNTNRSYVIKEVDKFMVPRDHLSGICHWRNKEMGTKRPLFYRPCLFLYS